jgi:hypothetical protein
MLSWIQSIFFFIVINFYWLFKNPAWAQLPGWLPIANSVALMLIAVIGLLSGINFLKIDRQAVYFVILLIFVPVFGNVADFFFGAHPHRQPDFVDADNASNALYGFRSPISSAFVFLIAARAIGGVVPEGRFLALILISAALQLVWAIPQAIYLFAADILHSLPIKPMSECSTGGECLVVIRATGLTSNPFYFSWYFLVIYLAAALLSLRKSNLLFLAIGAMSLSRSFIACSLPLYLYEARRNTRTAVVLIGILAVFGMYFLSDIGDLIDLRLAEDESKESRSLTNLWVLNEFLGGNFFGIGWEVNYFTDSTYATLLLRSGAPGVVAYAAAWLLFFRRMYILSGKNIVVVLFAVVFFLTSIFVSYVESNPGSLVLFSLYWILHCRRRGANGRINLGSAKVT